MEKPNIKESKELKLVSENANWERFSVYQFSTNKLSWQPISFIRPGANKKDGVQLGNTQVKSIKVVSLNVLFNYYDKDKIYTEKRYPLLMEKLEKLDADVYALEEVTNKFLKYIVNSNWLKSGYYVSDTNPCNTCDPYGQIIISKYPFAVEMCKYSPTKRAICGFFNINKYIFGLPVVHLISNNSAGAKRREKELRVIWNYVSKVADDILVVGDFNFREDDEHGNAVTQQNKFIDVWKYLHPQQPGYTFNPHQNAIAKINSTSKHAHRYDRMYLKSTVWYPKSIRIFGKQFTKLKVPKVDDEGSENGEMFDLNLAISDHYGLIATFQWDENLVEPVPLSKYLVDSKIAIDEKAINKREATIEQIYELLKPLGSFKLQPIGSYLIGSVTYSSDIDLICLANSDSKQFMNNAFKLFHSSDQIKHVRMVSDALIPVIVIHFKSGIKVDFQYACVSKTGLQISKQTNLSKTFKAEHLTKLDKVSLKVINAFFETNLILESVPDKNIFKEALLFIKCWAKVNGIDSNRMGLIGGHGWSVMLAACYENKMHIKSSDQLVKLFFETYCKWNWKEQPVRLSCVKTLPKYDPSKCQLPILQPVRPFSIITRNATNSTARLVKQVLSSTFQRICDYPSISWDQLLVCTSLPRFRRCNAFIKVSLSSSKRSEFIKLVTWIESRFVSLFIQLETKSGARVLLHPIAKPFNDPQSFNLFGWYYIFGIYHIEDEYDARDFDYATLLKSYLNELKQWEHFSPSMYISVDQVDRGQMPSSIKFSNGKKKNKKRKSSKLTPTSVSPKSNRKKNENTISFDNDVSEPSNKFDFSMFSNYQKDKNATDTDDQVNSNNNQLDDGKEQLQTSPNSKSQSDPKNKLNNKKKKKKKKKKKNKKDEPTAKVRLRPARDIYKKIKFNPNMDTTQYSIGYEDRFTGLQEVPFDEFLVDKLNPKGIPMHRIWYFKFNGALVWDRKTRIDLIFHSGNSAKNNNDDSDSDDSQ